MEITIEKNVSLPEADDNTWKAALDKLEHGDSFSFPLEKRASLASIISTEFHSLTDKRFRISVKNQPKRTARVWRIEDAINPTEVK